MLFPDYDVNIGCHSNHQSNGFSNNQCNGSISYQHGNHEISAGGHYSQDNHGGSSYGGDITYTYHHHG